MRVQVRFFTVLREITEKKEETLQFAQSEKPTVDSALKVLAKQYGTQFSEYVFNERTGAVKGFLQFFINGQSATTFSGLKTELHDGDVLAIVPPVGGG